MEGPYMLLSFKSLIIFSYQWKASEPRASTRRLMPPNSILRSEFPSNGPLYGVVSTISCNVLSSTFQKKKVTTNPYFMLIRKSIIKLFQVLRCRHVIAYLHELNANLEKDLSRGTIYNDICTCVIGRYLSSSLLAAWTITDSGSSAVLS